VRHRFSYILQAGCILMLLFAMRPLGADPFPITHEWFGIDAASRHQVVFEFYSFGIRNFGINGAPTEWQVIQRKEDGPYNFSLLDRLVKNISSESKHHDVKIEFGIRCNTPWATGVKNPEGVSSYPPKGPYPDGKYWQAWYKFVYTLAERYDGDGKDDMPGINRQVLFNLHLEDEMDSHWAKYTPEQFGQLTKITYKAIKDASPNIMVMRSATNIMMNLDDNPDLNTSMTRMKRFAGDHLIRYSIEKGYDDFDAFGMHPNYHYTGVAAQAKYINGLFDLYGKPRKPIIASDMNSTLHGFRNRPLPGSRLKRMFPDLQPDVDGNGIDDPLDVLNGKNPGGQYDAAETKKTYQADQANQIIKKLTLGMTVPYEQMFMSQGMDWPDYHIPIWNFGGFFDKAIFDKTGTLNTPGCKKPVFWAAKFWVNEFVGTTAATIIREDIEHNYASWCTYVIKLDHPKGTKYVAWSDKPKGDVCLFETNENAMVVYENISKPDQKEPQGAIVPAKNGRILLKLDKTPCLIVTKASGRRVSGLGKASSIAARIAGGGTAYRKPDLSIGKAAPAFTAPLLSGQEVVFPDNYKDKVVLLHFWSMGFQPSLRNVELIAAIYNKYHAQGFDILGINLDKKDRAKKIPAFTLKNNMAWPHVYDGQGRDAAVFRQYGVSLPCMLLVDGSKGTVLAGKKELHGEVVINGNKISLLEQAIQKALGLASPEKEAIPELVKTPVPVKLPKTPAPSASLHEAAKQGDVAQVKALITSSNINTQNKEGHTPLYAAVDQDRLEVARLLVAEGADVKTTDKYGYTPLHVAASHNQKEIAVLLLTAGASVNNQQNQDGVTPLHMAALWGREAAAELLIAQGANVNAKSKSGQTSLHLATSWNRTKMVKLLLAKGADVNAKDAKGKTALSIAESKGNKELVDLLFANGAKTE